MTEQRTGEPWRSADEYGRSLPAADKPHGWRDTWIGDPDGYVRVAKNRSLLGHAVDEILLLGVEAAWARQRR